MSITISAVVARSSPPPVKLRPSRGGGAVDDVLREVDAVHGGPQMVKGARSGRRQCQLVTH